MNRKAIFEYLGWLGRHSDEDSAFAIGCILHKLDGNDVLEAVRIMKGKINKDNVSDLSKFILYVHGQQIWEASEHFSYLLQNFFELLSEALDKGVVK